MSVTGTRHWMQVHLSRPVSTSWYLSGIIIKYLQRKESPGCLPLEVFEARPTAGRPRGRPRTRWRDYISQLAGIPQKELESVAGEREVWVSCWVCCLCDPTPD